MQNSVFSDLKLCSRVVERHKTRRKGDIFQNTCVRLNKALALNKNWKQVPTGRPVLTFMSSQKMFTKFVDLLAEASYSLHKYESGINQWNSQPESKLPYFPKMLQYCFKFYIFVHCLFSYVHRWSTWPFVHNASPLFSPQTATPFLKTRMEWCLSPRSSGRTTPPNRGTTSGELPTNPEPQQAIFTMAIFEAYRGGEGRGASACLQQWVDFWT